MGKLSGEEKSIGVKCTLGFERGYRRIGERLGVAIHAHGVVSHSHIALAFVLALDAATSGWASLRIALDDFYDRESRYSEGVSVRGAAGEVL
jgi:hypothetical protein